MSPNLWIEVPFEDPMYMRSRSNAWVDGENAAARVDDHITSTFFGRLHERVPALAATLAFADNPLKPVITIEQCKIAESILIAENKAQIALNNSGVLDGPWGALMKLIENVFKGKMSRHINLYVSKKEKESGKIELSKGAIGWSPLTRYLQSKEPFKIIKERNNYRNEIFSRVSSFNVEVMPTAEVKATFGHGRLTLIRK